jgi:hypothetical protein
MPSPMKRMTFFAVAVALERRDVGEDVVDNDTNGTLL